jgi:membrane protein implicated in regulation of membrane protease activity
MEIFSNPAVIWFLVGLGLLLLELAIPGFVVVFFGFGAWIVALTCAIFEIKLDIQILIFLVSSLTGLILLRKALKNRFFNKRDEEVREQLEEFIGKKAKAIVDFKNGSGKIEFKGTQWNAECRSDLKKGDSVKIEKKDSITLIVKPN